MKHIFSIVKNILRCLLCYLAQTDERPAETNVPETSPEREAGATCRNRPGGRPDFAGRSRADIVRFNEQFLREHYHLRFNTVKQQTEFRPKSADNTSMATVEWQPIDERRLNGIVVDQLKAGGGSWSYGMRLVLDSTCVEEFNPVRHFLDSCGAWDGRHNYIEDYASRVPTSYAEWPHYFHRWFLGMVAQALGLSRDHGNSLVPMLIGAQGVKKTTFCKNILPHAMRDYYMDDLKMDSAEQAERVLSRMWLVCIDEYNAKTDREQARLKRLLTERDVQTRRMRQASYTMMPRLASFIATTNDPTPLLPGDGTRRYLCVDVEGPIDMDTPIAHSQMFAQAMHELQQEGCIFWLTAADEQQVQQHNAIYQQQPPVEQILENTFTPTTNRRQENLWTLTAIQRLLAKTMRPGDLPSIYQLSTAIRYMRWPRGGSHGTKGYYVVVKSQQNQ